MGKKNVAYGAEMKKKKFKRHYLVAASAQQDIDQIL